MTKEILKSNKVTNNSNTNIITIVDNFCGYKIPAGVKNNYPLVEAVIILEDNVMGLVKK
jgi:hypothetical protein